MFSAVRAFRLFKIFKLFKAGDIKILLDSIAFTITSISDYVILLLLFIYVFSLIGMSFFAGMLMFDENDQPDFIHGQPPRNNFDDVLWSLITIFQILLGEQWNEIMYDCVRSQNAFAALYFIIWILVGNIIMLNLFLAILLGNFEKARRYRQKKQVFEAFNGILSKSNMNVALDIILGDLSSHVKKKVLKWDPNMVNKIYTSGETEIGIQLIESGVTFADFGRERSALRQKCYNSMSGAKVKLNKERIAKRLAKRIKHDMQKQTKKTQAKEPGAPNNNEESDESQESNTAITISLFHPPNPKLQRLVELTRNAKRTDSVALNSILKKKSLANL